MRKTIFRLALITIAVLLVAVAPALPQAVRRASITEVKKNGLPYRLIALTAPFSHRM